MITFPFRQFSSWSLALLLALIGCNTATAQVRSQAILLEPLSSEGVDIVPVRNVYGRCGSSVVQVLGVRQQNDDFYSVDGNFDVIVIREGGRPELSLKRYLSDYNGVACTDTSGGKRLLVWSNCSGSACGDTYSFVVVDPESLRIVGGEKSECNSLCASRLTRSNLPLQVDGISIGKSSK